MAYIDKDLLLKDIDESVVFSVREGKPSLEKGRCGVMAELKQCPFCGTDNVVLESYKARKGYEAYVQCNGGCMANQHTITYDTLEEAEAKAVEMWNTRTPQKEE